MIDEIMQKLEKSNLTDEVRMYYIAVINKVSVEKLREDIDNSIKCITDEIFMFLKKEKTIKKRKVEND